jgi:transposase
MAHDRQRRRHRRHHRLEEPLFRLTSQRELQTPRVERSLRRTIRLLKKEAGKVRAEADGLFAAAEALRAGCGLLEDIPGVGRRTATALAGLLAVERLPSAESAAACGLAPRECRRGASVKKRTRLSKAGNARLRKPQQHGHLSGRSHSS